MKTYNRLAWHGLTALLILLLCYGLYKAGQRVDYTWRWSAVPQYLISTQGEDITAPFSGFVEVNATKTQIILTELNGVQTHTISDYANLAVADGDLVFQNDVLANKAGIKPGPLLLGLWLTLKISIISLLLSLAIGLFAGLARVSSNPTLKSLSGMYIEIIRGTPLLVQIIIVYYFLGTVLNLAAFTAGVVALSLFTAAYVAEIIRAGIENVPKGQAEAARSLGMSHLQTLRTIILPQALRAVLPPLAGQSINLIKDSSLVSAIALTDLTKAGREVVGSTLQPFEIWFVVALLYLLLTGTLSVWVNRLERRYKNA